MAHHARINKNNIIIQVIVTSDDPNIEQWLADNLGGKWVKTSYNTKGGVHYGPDGQPDGGEALRYNFAGVGGTYDPEADAFYSPQPYPSWILNRINYTWEAPLPRPEGRDAIWNESVKIWEFITGTPPPPDKTGWTWDDTDKVWYKSNPLVS